MTTAIEMQSAVEKLVTNMDRWDRITNGPASGTGSWIEIDEEMQVPSLARYLGAAGNVGPLYPTLDAIKSIEIPSHLSSFFTAGRAGVGDGFAAQYILSTTEPPATVDRVKDQGGRWWRIAVADGWKTLRLRDYLQQTPGDPQAALVQAMQDLFSAGSTTTRLECDGIQIVANSPIVLNATNLNISGNKQKVIHGLTVVANQNVTWPTGAAVFKIHGSADGSPLRNVIFDRCMFHGRDVADVGFSTGEYYHLTLSQCSIQGFKVRGFETKLYHESGGHGLVLDDIDVLGRHANKGSKATQPLCAIYLEDGDTVIKGGWNSWTQIGVDSRRGGLHIIDHHCSQADADTPKVGIIVRSPRAVRITGCDMDGCSIQIENNPDNSFSPGVSVSAWRRIRISDNEFVAHPAADTVSGLIVLRTWTSQTSPRGLSIDDNLPVGGEDVTLCKFTGTGTGSWSSNFEGVMNASASMVDSGNFPGRNCLARTSYVWAYQTPDGDTVFGTTKANARGYFHAQTFTGVDKAPFVGSGGADQRALVFGTDEIIRWRIDESGRLRPDVTATYPVGTAQYRVSEVFASTGAINTSDQRTKTIKRDLTPAEMAAGIAISGMVGVYQFLDSVVEKGLEGPDAARLHFGWIAQEVRDAFIAQGLDPFRYGIVCHDEWIEIDPETGESVTKDLYSLRPAELGAFVIAAQAQVSKLQHDSIASLLGRVAALEAAA